VIVRTRSKILMSWDFTDCTRSYNHQLLTKTFLKIFRQSLVESNRCRLLVVPESKHSTSLANTS